MTTRAIAVSMTCASVAATHRGEWRISCPSLASVSRLGSAAELEPQGEAPEEGLLAQELGHAVAGALRGIRLNAGGHHAASRAGSTGVTK